MAGYDLISYAFGYRSFVVGTGMLSFVKVGDVPDAEDNQDDDSAEDAPVET